VLLVFAALALAYTASVWCGTTPYVGLAGDAANIATFVAARAHPELFPRDPVLADPQNYRFYATIHLPLIRALGAIVGSYGTAFLLLLPLHAWFQLTGFYALGMALFASRPWAVVLAAANAVTLHLPLGEIWGLWPDALPRVTFQALLPFLLAAACRWRSQPRAWPWLMLAMGALTYVHPVSFPAWALAIWLGFWPFLPAGWRVHERAACLVLLGLVCSAVAAPFAWLYVSSFETGVKPPEIVAMWTRALFVSFRDAPGATAEFVGVLWTLGLAPCALVAAAVVARASQLDRRAADRVFVAADGRPGGGSGAARIATAGRPDPRPPLPRSAAAHDLRVGPRRPAAASRCSPLAGAARLAARPRLAEPRARRDAGSHRGMGRAAPRGAAARRGARRGREPAARLAGATTRGGPRDTLPRP
jgi:hypothetical protein